MLCAVATVARSAMAKSENRIRVIRFLLFIVFSLVLFRSFEAGGLGIRLAHEFSGLGFAVPTPTFVVDAAIGVDPNHAITIRGWYLLRGRWLAGWRG